MNYSEVMDNLIEKKPGWSEAEYKHYYFTMDAIASRHPKRMKETRPGERNGMLEQELRCGIVLIVFIGCSRMYCKKKGRVCQGIGKLLQQTDVSCTK